MCEMTVEAIERAEPPKEEKTKVTFKIITINGSKEKPCYGIMYKEVGKEDYTQGFGSYNIDFVREWFDDCLELVEEQIEPTKEKPKVEWVYAIFKRRFREDSYCGYVEEERAAIRICEEYTEECGTYHYYLKVCRKVKK